MYPVSLRNYGSVFRVKGVTWMVNIDGIIAHLQSLKLNAYIQRAASTAVVPISEPP